MKKLFFTVVASAVFIPVFVYASWWNPLTWFGSKDNNVTQYTVPEPREINPSPLTETQATSSKKIDACFGTLSLKATTTEVSAWKLFETLGFALKYPEDMVTIDLADKTGNSDMTYKITDVKHGYSAFVKMYKLKESSYRATYKNSPSIVYELRSNTWWKDQYVWDPATLEECSPNESGKTNDGKYSIYTTGDGDAGAFYTNYFIVLRDVTKTDNYEPLVIQFRISGDGNDPNFNFFKSFNDILEMMIKTVELRPTSRG
jgi:hypothetical protein